MECPECATYIHNRATSCKCGWKQDRAAAKTGDNSESLALTDTEHLYRKLATLPPEFQSLIAAAREDKIIWKGETMPQFIKVINETKSMRAMGVDRYRAEVVRPALKRVIRKTVTS